MCGCSNKQQEFTTADVATVIDTAKIDVCYAEGFSIDYINDNVCLLKIQDPHKENTVSYKYALTKKGSEHERIPEDYVRIDYPISSTICMTSLQLSNFIKLNATDVVVGITSTRHLFNKDIKKQIEDGHTVRIGIEGNFDNEKIIGINPDIILISPFKRGGYEILKEINIPLIPHLGYKERSPLAQAEWIKFVGLLLGKTEIANTIFRDIEKRYNDLKYKVISTKNRPMVLSGETRGSTWYAPGGKSFLAQLFNDAGANYFLNSNNESGGINLDFETVYSRAANAQYWRIVNNYAGDFTYEALSDEDERYEDFRAFKEKGIIYCNMSKTPFYESMPMEPDLILPDFIHIFHPEILPDHSPVYYSLLK
jgi:iron complex transport system substrate-binding protein